jgi:hypothetical protein
MNIEKRFLICKDPGCTEDTFNSEKAQLEDDFQGEYKCISCDQRYYFDENGFVFNVFDELIFESFESLVAFIGKFGRTKLKIGTLNLRNISDIENFRFNYYFKNCSIQTLIIENISISTATPPFAFIDCEINDTIIKNSRFGKSTQNNILNTFGLNILVFSGCTHSNRFIISACETNIVIMACNVSCDIEIEDSQIPQLYLLHNETEPQIKPDHRSKINIVRSQLEAKREVLTKPDLSLSGVIEACEIPELEISSKIKGQIRIKDSLIKKLVFHKTEEIEAELIFEGCTIEELGDLPICFNKSLVFINCTFKQKLKLFSCGLQSLLIEACTLEQGLSLRKVTIKQNLYLGHSQSDGPIKLELVNCDGSVFFNFSRLKGCLVIDQSRIEGYVQINACKIDKTTTISSGKISGELEIISADLNGEINIEHLSCSKLTAFSSRFAEKIKLFAIDLNKEMVFRNSEFFKEVDISSLSVCQHLFVDASVFHEKLDFFICSYEGFFVQNNIFYSEVNFCQINTPRHSYFHNNILIDDVGFNELQAGDIDFKYNKALDAFNISKSAIDDLEFTQNKFNDLEIENCTLGGLNFNKNKTHESFTMEGNIFRKNATINGNKFQGLHTKIQSTTFNNSLTLSRNKIKSDFYFTKNTVQQDFEYANNTLDVNCPLRIVRNNLLNLIIEKSLFYAQVFITDNRINAMLSIGTQPGKGTSHRMVLSKGTLISNNRLRTFNMFNVGNLEAFCFLNNHLEGEFFIREGYFKKDLDMGGSYFGGSAKINNFKNTFEGNLILDDTFFDKRLSLNDTNPKHLSFVGANLNGFNIPDEWQIIGHQLRTSEDKIKFIIHDDQLRSTNPIGTRLPYNILKAYWQEDHDFLNLLHNFWSELFVHCFTKKAQKILENEIEGFPKLLLCRDLISEILKQDFITVYYGIIEEGGLENIFQLSKHFETFEPSSTDPKVLAAEKSLQDFLEIFLIILESFNEGKITGQRPKLGLKQFYKKRLSRNLMNQYLVLRQVYARNGEHSNEDKAYFQWMHYKNLYESHTAKWHIKPFKFIKRMVFEKVFGWGVNLKRLGWSTLLMVSAFALTYFLIFRFNPELEIKWDGNKELAHTLSFAKVFTLTLQTTFGAFFGDWSPVGNNVIKFLMTLNTALGVLFITFFVGAYGRKMLR